MVSREGYYDYMLRRTREENTTLIKFKKTGRRKTTEKTEMTLNYIPNVKFNRKPKTIPW